jgi:crotonobetainyl-CoA:carnitine CoA-transferase CaiB-like acyl-CoA transferase
LLDAALHMQCQELTYHLNGGQAPPRENDEVGHPLEPGPYGVYPTADGQFVAVSSGPWPNLCRALGTPALEHDPRYDTPQKRLERRREVQAELAAIFRREPRAVWVTRLGAEGVWSAPVYAYAEIDQDPQVQWGGMIATLRHGDIGEYRVIGNPVRMSATPPSYRTPPPPLGADTEAVLADLGFAKQEIDRLRAEGAV